MKCLTVLLALVLSLFAVHAVAQVDPECLKDNLKKITDDRKVQMLTADGDRLEVIIDHVDYTNKTLTIADMLEADISGTTYHFEDITGLRFQKPHRFKPGWMLFGAAAGATLGYLAASSGKDEGDESFKPLVVPIITLFGGGIGLLGGTFLPLVLSGGTVECGNFTP